MINLSSNDLYGLYIHVPFCLTKCPYCSFYSIRDLSKVDDYFLALRAELKLYKDKGFHVDTVYFGGGTPSVVNSRYICGVLESIHKYFNVISNPEITLELNPCTVHYDKLQNYYLAGINRLSIGMQSTCNRTLAFLGRLHNSNDFLKVFFWAREIGFNNLGLDLIYGIPGQNVSKLQREMKKVIKMGAEHLSCYLLTFEPETPMGDKVLSGKIIPSKDALISKMFTFVNNFLAEHDYNRYEVSNFSKSLCGDVNYYMSKHNSKYWNFDNYIGFGPSAHSLIDNNRWWNYSCLDYYLADILNNGVLPIEGKEELTFEQQITEFMYLGLRQSNGISLRLFESVFGVGIFYFFAETITNLLKDGFAKVENDRMILTDKGFLFLDSVALQFCL